MVERRLPRWSELRELARPRPPTGDATARRLAAAATVADLREIARRRVPRAVFDYTDGAAGAEISLRRSREAFERVEFRPSVLRDVSAVDPSTHAARRPVGAAAGLRADRVHPAHAHRGRDRGRPRRRAGRRSRTRCRRWAPRRSRRWPRRRPGARRWFQLYLWRDREASAALVERARAAGYEALVLTVDTPVAGPRLRDVRNGFTIPPALTLRTMANAAVHPALVGGPAHDPAAGVRLAALLGRHGRRARGPRLRAGRRRSPTSGRCARRWPGALVVKGVQGADDARAVVDAGADAVVVSNHGGRQLDRAPTPLEQLPAIVAAVGDRAEVYVDGGILDGADVVAAVAVRGPCLPGRPGLPLRADGRRRARACSGPPTSCAAEVTRTMQLLGVTSVAELTPGPGAPPLLRSLPPGPASS